MTGAPAWADEGRQPEPLPEDEVSEAIRKNKMAEPTPPSQVCVKCGAPIGFHCQQLGPICGVTAQDLWLCDDHAFDFRSQGHSRLAVKMSTREEILGGIQTLEMAAQNLGQIMYIQIRDPAGVDRDVRLGLDYKTSGEIFKRIAAVLVAKVTQ